MTQLGDPAEVEDLLDPLAHDVGWDGELLHAVGQLLLNGIGHEPGKRILADHAEPEEPV